jgi:uncharacterized protein YhhL (DUF1145 family)
VIKIIDHLQPYYFESHSCELISIGSSLFSNLFNLFYNLLHFSSQVKEINLGLTVLIHALNLLSLIAVLDMRANIEISDFQFNCRIVSLLILEKYHALFSFVPNS